MKNDIQQLKGWIDEGIVLPGVGWGDARETACLMTALTGLTSKEGCVADGWPGWLVELGTFTFDNAGFDWRERSIGFGTAVQVALDRDADLSFDGEVFRAFRLSSVLPMAMEGIGEGDEGWRIMCRDLVQRAIDGGGFAYLSKRSALAAKVIGAALAAEASGSVGAVGAAFAVRTVWASGAAGAAWAAWAAGEAYERIYNGIVSVLEGEQ